MSGNSVAFLRQSLERMALGGQRFLPEQVLRQIAETEELADTVAKVLRTKWQAKIAEAFNRFGPGQMFPASVAAVEGPVVPVPPARHDYLTPRTPFLPEDRVPPNQPVACDLRTWGLLTRADLEAEREGFATANLADVSAPRYGDGKRSKLDVKLARAAKREADFDVEDARETLDFTIAELEAAKRRGEPEDVMAKIGGVVAQAAQDFRDALERRAEQAGPNRYKRQAATRYWVQVLHELGHTERFNLAELVPGEPEGIKPVRLYDGDFGEPFSDNAAQKHLQYLVRRQAGKGRTARLRFNLTTRADRKRQASAREDRERRRQIAAQQLDAGNRQAARQVAGIPQVA